jgi:hypothetical protein
MSGVTSPTGYLERAVFAALRNAFAVGAPLLPGFRIFSPLPLAILLRFAWIFAYNPFLFAGMTYF